MLVERREGEEHDDQADDGAALHAGGLGEEADDGRAQGGARWPASEWGKVTPPPITRETAMASPRARPMARVMAASIPDRAPGMTARRTTCHWVPPRASAASRSATDTPCKAVRVRATMVGSIMTASTDGGQEDARPEVAAAEEVLQQRDLLQEGLDVALEEGDRGRAGPTGRRRCSGRRPAGRCRSTAARPIRRGRNSERAAAVAMPTGMAMSRPTPVVIRVSTMKTPAPNCSVSGFQVPLKMKLKPECRNAGAACQTRLTTNDTTTATKTRTPPHRMVA